MTKPKISFIAAFAECKQRTTERQQIFEIFKSPGNPWLEFGGTTLDLSVGDIYNHWRSVKKSKTGPLQIHPDIQWKQFNDYRVSLIIRETNDILQPHHDYNQRSWRRLRQYRQGVISHILVQFVSARDACGQARTTYCDAIAHVRILKSFWILLDDKTTFALRFSALHCNEFPLTRFLGTFWTFSFSNKKRKCTSRKTNDCQQ